MGQAPNEEALIFVHNNTFGPQRNGYVDMEISNLATPINWPSKPFDSSIMKEEMSWAVGSAQQQSGQDFGHMDQVPNEVNKMRAKEREQSFIFNTIGWAQTRGWVSNNWLKKVNEKKERSIAWELKLELDLWSVLQPDSRLYCSIDSNIIGKEICWNKDFYYGELNTFVSVAAKQLHLMKFLVLDEFGNGFKSDTLVKCNAIIGVDEMLMTKVTEMSKFDVIVLQSYGLIGDVLVVLLLTDFEIVVIALDFPVQKNYVLEGIHALLFQHNVFSFLLLFSTGRIHKLAQAIDVVNCLVDRDYRGCITLKNLALVEGRTTIVFEGFASTKSKLIDIFRREEPKVVQSRAGYVEPFQCGMNNDVATKSMKNFLEGENTGTVMSHYVQLTVVIAIRLENDFMSKLYLREIECVLVTYGDTIRGSSCTKAERNMSTDYKCYARVVPLLVPPNHSSIVTLGFAADQGILSHEFFSLRHKDPWNLGGHYLLSVSVLSSTFFKIWDPRGRFDFSSVMALVKKIYTANMFSSFFKMLDPHISLLQKGFTS